MTVGLSLDVAMHDDVVLSAGALMCYRAGGPLSMALNLWAQARAPEEFTAYCMPIGLEAACGIPVHPTCRERTCRDVMLETTLMLQPLQKLTSRLVIGSSASQSGSACRDIARTLACNTRAEAPTPVALQHLKSSPPENLLRVLLDLKLSISGIDVEMSCRTLSRSSLLAHC